MLRSNSRKQWLFAIYTAPAFVLYSVFVIYALGMAFYYSALNWNGIGAKQFAGLDNYFSLFRESDYWLAAKNTLVILVLALLVQNPIALLLAFFVTRISKGYRFFRSAIFLPVVIPTAATGLMFGLILNNDLDILNGFLRTIGLDWMQQKWLTDKHVVLYSVAIPQLWQNLGYPFVIFLAAIHSVPKDLVESAHIDGATGFQVVSRIIVPLLRDIIIIVTILSVSGIMKSFDMPFVMTMGGPGFASSYIANYMYYHTFSAYHFSYGVTVAMTIFLYTLAITLILRRFFRKEAIQY